MLCIYRRREESWRPKAGKKIPFQPAKQLILFNIYGWEQSQQTSRQTVIIIVFPSHAISAVVCYRMASHLTLYGLVIKQSYRDKQHPHRQQSTEEEM